MNQRRRRFPSRYESLELRRVLAVEGEITPLLPDLISTTDEARGLLYGWTVEVQEAKTLLRFSTTTANLGQGAMELRGGTSYPDGTQDVYQRIYQSDGSFADRLAGRFVFHEAHGHVHFEAYAEYNLRAVLPDDGVGDVVATSGKTSFCLLDVLKTREPQYGEPELPQYSGCESEQGISVGWADMYENGLADQWIDVTGVPEGKYWLEVVVDPEDHLLEMNEANNTVRILIDYHERGTTAPDALEPSESSMDSWDLGNTAPQLIENLSIHSPGNEDWYYWDAPETGILTADLTFDPTASDLNFFLYGTGPFYQVAEAIGSTTSETIRYPVLRGETYVLRIIEASGRTGSYDLKLSVEEAATDPLADVMEPNESRQRAKRISADNVLLNDLTIHSPLDRDFFRWTPADSGVLDVAIRFDAAVGDLGLYVYDANGRLRGWSDTADGVERVQMDVVEDKSYFIKIFGNGVSDAVTYSIQTNLRLSRVVGDANGDGLFDSADLIQVFQAGEYEDLLPGNSMYHEGDWNGDGDFDSSDLVLAFQAGGYVATATPRVNAFAAADAVFAALAQKNKTRVVA